MAIGAEGSSMVSENKKRRTKDAGVRVVGDRIYDSENGKSCHQCRQKTLDFMSSCKNMKKDKLCTISFCHKCLLNRYGEKAGEVNEREDWNCPKCRGVCNCSQCMKRKGLQPTGCLIQTAKVNGFSSVHELLGHHKGTEALNSTSVVEAPSFSPPSSAPNNTSDDGECADQKENINKEARLNLKNEVDSTNTTGSPSAETKVLVHDDATIKPKLKLCKSENLPFEAYKKSCKEDIVLPQGSTKGNPSAENKALVHDDATIKPKLKSCKLENLPFDAYGKSCKDDIVLPQGSTKGNPSAENKAIVHDDATIKPKLKLCKSENLPFEAYEKSCEEDVVLPQGSPLVEVAGVELLPQDVGPALQFLEFCNSFGKVLGIKKGQPEYILRDIVRGRVGRRGMSSSPVVGFIIKLLSLIEDDVKGKNWVEALGRCIAESECPLDSLPENTFDRGISGYDSLEQSEKMRILNFLCDEILGTLEIRNWIDEDIAKFDEEAKEIKEKVNVVRKEEKLLKQKLKDNISQALISTQRDNITLSEHDHIISKIRTKADKEHAELLKIIEDLPKKKQRSKALGTKPILVKGNGCAYWKLRSYNNNSNIILQDIGTWDSVRAEDNWYFFNEEEEKAVEIHISYTRNPKRKRQRSTQIVSAEDVKEIDLAGPNLAGPVALSCPALDKMDKLKAIMNMRALK